ncbi:hypothetical protein DdX_02777 [Ditylenchus destructor]|uniref:Uncharacterized protein n=1 Tax=Ditylenchus destructor TaxID=166010 RepID=A0AAD4ND77_9BILA|nr:hypothetical protein DdX_02777 [Ditylenchus destructor]
MNIAYCLALLALCVLCVFGGEADVVHIRARRFKGGYQQVGMDPREFNYPHDKGPKEGKGFGDKGGKMVGLGKNFSRP